MNLAQPAAEPAFIQALAALDHPEKRIPTILIGGTNGKGTTAAALAYLLSQSGLRVGLFMSPHVQNIRERFVIDGNYISELELKQVEQELRIVPAFSSLNTFEQLTLMAWIYFTERQVDIAVLEVGMGGRFDPTNISNPQLSVITSIDLDHQQFLGNSRQEILTEKLPIARAQAPLIFAEPAVELKHLAKSWSEKNQVTIKCLIVADKLYPHNCYAIAQESFQHCRNPSAKTSPTINIHLPARDQQINNYWIDLAHNDAALLALSRRVSAPFSLIIAKPKNRNWNDGLSALAKNAARVICPQSSYCEAGAIYFTQAELLREQIAAYNPNVTVVPDLAAALSRSQSEPTLICGSSRLAGQCLDLLNYDTMSHPLYSLDPSL